MNALSRNWTMRPRACTLAAMLASFVIFSLGVAPRANAQENSRLTERLDPAVAAAVSEVVEGARALGLPTEPLIQKALEGHSKGASAEAILAAVQALSDDLGAARATLGEGIEDDALLIAAAALDAGGSPALLERLRPFRSNEAFTGGLTGMVYLLSRGVEAEQSFDLISSMMEARLSDGAFFSLQQQVERDLMVGTPVSEAATVRANALIRHGPTFRRGGGVQP